MTELEKLLSKKDDNFPWNNEVPIITHDNGDMEVYLTDTIQEPIVYNELCHKLRLAPASSTVTLHINTPGGIIDSAFMIIDAMKASKAHVHGALSGTVASAGTIISLACTTLSVADHTAFMIHNYSGAVVGKGNEMRAHQEFVDKNLNVAFTSFYSGFLTAKEIKEVIDGRDLWFNKDEVLDRWTSKATPPAASKTRGRPKKA